MELTRTPDVEVPRARFVPDDLELSPDTLRDLVQRLLDRPVASARELEAWIIDWSELGSRLNGEWARRMTAMHRETGDETIRDSFLTFQREIGPVWEQLEDKLNRRYLESPFRAELGERFFVFDRAKETEARIFREENTQLSVEEQALVARYQEVQGNVTVPFRGEELTKEQCAAHFQDPDRAVREEAFLALGRRLQKEKETLDEVFDGLVALRHRKATNAGFERYTEYRFADLERFDYTPADCVAFQEAVEKVVVPALTDLREERRRRLGLETLRPWDLDVSLFGGTPSRLFEDQAGFVDLMQRIFEAVDPVFGEEFQVLVRNGLLDLMSRPGKAPGGYNCAIDDMRLPFIFFNAVGRLADLRVLLHEGGHAFHTLAARDIDVLPYRSAPAEFSEVASMSMELFGLERLHGVIGEEESREFNYEQLERMLRTFTGVAQGDAFQHWMYAHPGHTAEDRRKEWGSLSKRFSPGIDWSGLEEILENGWQSVPHWFSHPLYFIDYAIAQIGALQMWRNEKRDHEAAVAGYRRALALGGSRPLPELFEAAGIRFAMDEAMLEELASAVHERARALLG